MRDMGDGAPQVSGYHTPEIGSHAHCDGERALGKRAKARMQELLSTPGTKIIASDEDDGRYQRPLVWIVLPDGRSIGGVLIGEGLARKWTPGYHGDWC